MRVFYTKERIILEIYVLVARKKSIAVQLVAYFFFLVAVVLLLFSCSSTFFLPFAVLMAGLWYLFQFRFNKEFEYSYFDGELRFAKIMNKSRRKRIGSYNMEEVLQIAPAGDRSMYKYENDANTRKLDYTSGQKGVPYYEMVLKHENELKLIKFEPDEKYLDAVCVKYAQKVTRA